MPFPGVNPFTISVPLLKGLVNSNCRIGFNEISVSLKLRVEPAVIRIEKGNIGRIGCLDPQISCRADTQIFLLKVDEAVAVPVCQFFCSVGRAVIDKDQLKVREALSQDRVNCPEGKLAAVICWDYYGELCHGFSSDDRKARMVYLSNRNIFRFHNH